MQLLKGLRYLCYKSLAEVTVPNLFESWIFSLTHWHYEFIVTERLGYGYWLVFFSANFKTFLISISKGLKGCNYWYAIYPCLSRHGQELWPGDGAFQPKCMEFELQKWSHPCHQLKVTLCHNVNWFPTLVQYSQWTECTSWYRFPHRWHHSKHPNVLQNFVHHSHFLLISWPSFFLPGIWTSINPQLRTL